MIILACNTASAEALRKLQQEYLPAHYPDRRILGVLIPTAEEVIAQTKNNKVGIIATQATVSSKAYLHEIHKLEQTIEVFQQATPLLVPLIENNALKYAPPMLDDYLAPLLAKNIDTLVLGCTHYPLLKPIIQSKVGTVKILSQTDVIPVKLTSYLERHQEIDSTLSRNSHYTFLTTDISPSTDKVAAFLFGRKVTFRKIIVDNP